MFEDAAWSLITDTRRVEILARKLLSQMRVVTVLSTMTVASQEKLTQILCQVNGRLPLTMLLLLLKCTLFAQGTLWVIRTKRIINLRTSQ